MMKPRNTKDYFGGILIVIGFSIVTSNTQNVYGVHPAKQPLQVDANDMYHISGTVTDVSTGAPIQNAKIVLLNSDTRDIIYDDIYTDDNGNYDETLDIDLTDIDDEHAEFPSTHYLIKSYPNPISAATSDHFTIQYTVPRNQLKTPTIEMYNILGRKINPSGYLLAGVYFFRLRFKDGYVTNSKKIVVTSGGRLNVSLEQRLEKSRQKLGKDIGLTRVLDDSIEVLFVIEKDGFIHTERTKHLFGDTNNVNDFALVPAGQMTSAVIDSTGGSMAVVNDRGDTITLRIPRYAIWNPTEITLTALNTQPNNPIAKNIFPGVSIMPSGVGLLQPATLRVTFASVVPDTNAATLLLIRQSDFVLPIGDQAVTDSTIQGEIYHFSEIIGGEPTTDEATPQAGKAGNGGPSDPYGWEDTYDCVDALLWWAEFLTRNGRIEEGQECFDKAKEIVERDARDFLNLPIPDNPCGEYRTALLKFAELVNSLVGGDLEIQIQDRVIEVVNMCNLRGEIEYNHHVICTDIDRYTDTRIIGNIPFYVNTLVQPIAAISGGGTARVIITGTQEECTISGSGTHRVHDISGEMKADSQGIYWLEMTLDETWYESTIVSRTCPDPDNNDQIQLPSFRYPTQLRFLVEDGWELRMPDVDCAGYYQWTLYIIHQP